MAYKDCLTEISKAAGRTFSDDELLELYEQLQSYTRKRRKADAGAAEDAILLGAADDMAVDLEIAAKIEKRNAALNMKARLAVMDRVRNQFADLPDEGLKSVLIGVNRPRRGARLSAAAEQNQLISHYLGGFIADMEKLDLWKAFVSGLFDRDIARALRAMDDEADPPAGITREAQEMAKVIHKWQEVTRLDANAAGAWIKKLPGYIVRQSHDIYKIRGKGTKADYEAWRDYILTKLDIDRTFDGEMPDDKVMKTMWQNLASGIHLKAGPPESTGLKGWSNLGKKLSHHRELHFRSADDWMDYNDRFGTRSLHESVLNGLDWNGKATGLMRRMGPNPEANFNLVVGEIVRGIDDPNAREHFVERANGQLTHALRAVDGTVHMPVNHLGARISTSLRAVQRMAKLGGSMISSFSDLGTYGSEMRYQGRSGLSGVGEAVGHLIKGRGGAERRQMLGMLGAYSDMMRGDASARFSMADDGMPGGLAKLQQQFFKFNGLTWWTDSLRTGAIAAMSHRLALIRDTGWADIDPDLARTLSLYDIGEADWNAIRASEPFSAEENAYIVPEAIGDRVLADKYRSYLIDRANYAVTMPDQATKAVMLRGTRPGTIEGEFLRFIGELKSFSVSFIQKSIGREIYGRTDHGKRGFTALREALRNGNGEMAGMAWLMVQMTALGYLSMTVKDLLKGREPRDPLDRDTWLAAMAQGGGMGIYGDFLFGDVNRFGGGLVATLVGPTIGAAEDLHSIATRMRDGDDAAAATFRFALQNTPFANLFYSRIVLDYLFLHSLQEALNPGSLRRMEKRIEKENNQKFLLRPSRDRVRVFE